MPPTDVHETSADHPRAAVTAADLADLRRDVRQDFRAELAAALRAPECSCAPESWPWSIGKSTLIGLATGFAIAVPPMVVVTWITS